MAGQIDPKQQHLDDHYGDLDLKIVPGPKGGAGMTSKEAGVFLRALRPVARVGQTLGQVVKKAAGKG